MPGTPGNFELLYLASLAGPASISPPPCLDSHSCLTPILALTHRWYRVVPGEVYLTHFASDRSHMRSSARHSDESGGGGSGGGDDDGREWSAPPPPYPCIVAADGCTNNLYR